MLAARRGHSTALTVPLSHQATELLEAILEGYPKSKKQFFVSTKAKLSPRTMVAVGVALPVLPGRGHRPAEVICACIGGGWDRDR